MSLIRHSFLRLPINICSSTLTQFTPQKLIHTMDNRTRHDDDWYSEQEPHVHPYHNLYTWRSLEQFVDRLYSSILYEDEAIVAIDKPYGVGIHLPHPTITKQNKHVTDALAFGDPRFCIDDALPHLSSRLKVQKLGVIRSIDRFESGIVLLAKDDDAAKKVHKSLSRSKCDQKPFANFWCITKGYPVMAGNFISEKITVQKVDVDELGDYREPILVNMNDKISRKFRQLHEQDFTTAFIEMRVLETNRKLAVSLVQIGTSNHKFSLVRCYAASKTCFIIGDTRFAKRVRHVLGCPVTLKPSTVPVNKASFEPLPLPLCKRLLVHKNSSIPLLMHLKSLNLRGYKGKGKDGDLEIVTPNLPPHFEWSRHRLFL